MWRARTSWHTRVTVDWMSIALDAHMASSMRRSCSACFTGSSVSAPALLSCSWNACALTAAEMAL